MEHPIYKAINGKTCSNELIFYKTCSINAKVMFYKISCTTMWKFLLDNTCVHIACLNAKLISDKPVMHNHDEIPAQITQSPELPIDESQTLFSHICFLSLCNHTT